jgi:DNA adenine methylase
MNMQCKSAIKRHGGKHYLASRIISLMRPHKRYCEPFFGSGAVMLQKECEGIAEYANDLDSTLTLFWQVLRSDTASSEFIRMANMQPFEQKEFFAAKARQDTNKNVYVSDAIQHALDFFIVNRQSRQALGRDFATPTERLRRGMNENVSAWLSAVDGLPELHERLRRVEIWNCDAIEFIDKLDIYGSCFYLDPPYMHDTRSSIDSYGKYEMSTDQHIRLLDYLNAGMRGDVLISGYRNEMYDEKLKYWRRVDFEIPNHSSSAMFKEIKQECIWLNY